MSNLKLIMSQGSKTAELEIEQATDGHKQTAIERLMRFFGVRDIEALPVVSTSGIKLPKLEKIIPFNSPANDKVVATIAEPGEIIGTLPKNKPEKLPLIGSDRTLQTSIGEVLERVTLEAVDSVPDHYKTGIKYKEGVPHYKMRYWCQNPKCRDKANDYIPVDQMIVNCRQCGMALTVMPAAPKGERDGYGNYFIANRPAKGAEG